MHESTILIADDEPLSRNLMKTLWSREGYNLTFANNGTEALAKAAEVTPDLILLDIMMPGMDGFEVCQHLRADPLLSTVPIVMVTALDDRDSRSQGIEAGADGLNLYIRLSDTARYSHGKDFDTIIQRARSLLEEVRANHPDLILRFSGEDAFRTSEADLFRVYDEIAPLVDRFGTPDSVGVATPTRVTQRLQALQQRYPDKEFEGHFHDDRGFALVNALESVKGGMRYIQTTLLGVGERVEQGVLAPGHGLVEQGDSSQRLGGLALQAFDYALNERPVRSQHD